MARKMTKTEQKIQNILTRALNIAKRSGATSISEIKPNIEHVAMLQKPVSMEDGSKAYLYHAIVIVLKYPDEEQMDWFDAWEYELVNNQTSTLKMKYVFFDESGDLYYVFEGIVVQ